MNKVEVLQQDLRLAGFYDGEIDGLVGPKTIEGMRFALSQLILLRKGKISTPIGAREKVIPAQWLSNVKMDRIICHWSAGSYNASSVDKEHYHIMIEGDGNLVVGDHPIEDNVNTIDLDYAAHTRGCNTGSIGVSLCCMLDAQESPFNVGSMPMTKVQWDKMISVVAELCQAYKIAVSPRTVLSHAEVQGTLGLRQSGKWDFTRLPFDLNVKGSAACGNKLRAEVLEKMQ